MSEKSKNEQSESSKVETGKTEKSKKADPKTPPSPGVLIKTAEIRLDQIEIASNTRKALEEPSGLAASFRVEGGETSGQLQEIGVELIDPVLPRYRLIYGHRRHRAAQLEGWVKIRAAIWNLDGSDPIFKQLAENGRRTQIGPIEEAEGFKGLMDNWGMTQAEIARRYGCDRSYVNHRLKLLTSLAEPVIKLVGNGPNQLSVSKALAITQIEVREQEQIANSALRQDWSLRRIEEQVKAIKQGTVKLKQASTEQPTELIIPDPVKLPYLKTKPELSQLEILKVAIYALLRNGNDQELLDYMEDNYIPWKDLWRYPRQMDDREAWATLEFLTRRYIEAPHRYSSLEPELKDAYAGVSGEATATFPREKTTPPVPVDADELNRIALPPARTEDQQ